MTRIFGVMIVWRISGGVEEQRKRRRGEEAGRDSAPFPLCPSAQRSLYVSQCPKPLSKFGLLCRVVDCFGRSDIRRWLLV
jgi:hypothetical protein